MRRGLQLRSSGALFRRLACSQPPTLALINSACSAPSLRSQPRFAADVRLRMLSDQTTMSVQRSNAYVVLGLEPGATEKEIKRAYRELAKRTHPDVLARKAKEAKEAAAAGFGPKVSSYDSGVLDARDAAAPTAVAFIEVQAAYDILTSEDDGGGAAKKRQARRPGAAGQARARTLGEVLCDRLKDEPEAVRELWEEICRDKLRVTNPMLDAIFAALKTVGKSVGTPEGVVDAARFGNTLIRDGSGLGLLTQDTRNSAQVSLLSWCQANEEELGDVAFEFIDEINDEDRAHSPAVMSAIGAVFCSGTRSPY